MKNLIIFTRTMAFILLWGTAWGQDSTNDSWISKNGNVNTNENVGIGVTTPEGNLQIGRSTLNGMLFLGGGKGYSGIGSTRSDGGLLLGFNVYSRYDSSADNFIGRVGKSLGSGFSGIKLGNNGQIDFFGKKGNVTADAVANASPNIKLKIATNGNVGIGTTDPQNKLDINGTARAKEILVEEGWGDYVFCEDYALPSLAEEEKHIEEKGHLSGFQSAEEMNGEIQLGDVTKRQQVKIEEMMLHILKMNERLEQLEKENAKLKSQGKRR